MKRQIAGLFVMLFMALAASGAMAEGKTCWMSSTDDYYHLNKNCEHLIGAKDEMNVDVAKMLGKQPCAACAAGEKAEAAESELVPGVEAVERGGTWLLRVPKVLMYSAEVQPSNTPALQYSLPMLYAATMSGFSDVRLAVPADSGLFMSIRLIDGDCYLLTRPERRYTSKAPFVWRTRAISPDAFGGGKATENGSSEEIRSVPEQSSDSYNKVFQSSYGALDITIYQTMSVNVAVIYWRPEEDPGMYCQLTLNGEATDIIVEGYHKGSKWVYCCVLTDAEVGELLAGSELGMDAIAAPDEQTAGVEATDAPQTQDDGEAKQDGVDATEAPQPELPDIPDESGEASSGMQGIPESVKLPDSVELPDLSDDVAVD